jgi:anthranilate/para-aminobenzoate synthase component I
LIDPGSAPDQAVLRARRGGAPVVLFDGRGDHDNAWPARLALDPKQIPSDLPSIDRRVAERRRRGGPGGSGVAVVLPYEMEGSAAFEFDASIALPSPPPRPANTTTFGCRRPRTSLPRDAYLRAIETVKRHIAAGDIYQANLTQMLACDFDGDPWDLYQALAAATPAPRSAYVETPDFVLASVSPETFVDVDRTGRATTLPIKGTRKRGGTEAEDERLERELLASAKDRAELTMIVDLERNDLGRIAKTGTVRVPELAALRTYPAVHHLVATVTAELKEGTGFEDLVRAVFPGGSITGAPKLRAIEILKTLEPVPRGPYTGSLFFLDDDGSTWSSILIRSVVVRRGVASLGAGGGVVADSDPEGEWMESNAKARALTRVLGFEPEEAV